MTAKRVLIVSPHGLFREGLKNILAGELDLAFAEHADSIQEAEEQARLGQIDVMIVDQARDERGQKSHAEAIARLLQVPGLRVVVVSLETGDLWIYRQERVIEASVEDLVSALID